MSRKPLVYLLLAGAALAATPLIAEENEADVAAVRQVIETAYVRGVFVDRDPDMVRAGFHPEFVMPLVLEGEVLVAPLEMWLERIGLDGVPGTEKVEPSFEIVDVTGDTAIAKVLMFFDGEQRYTDYFALYRRPDGWKIVSKIFAVHD